MLLNIIWGEILVLVRRPYAELLLFIKNISVSIIKNANQTYYFIQLIFASGKLPECMDKFLIKKYF